MDKEASFVNNSGMGPNYLPIFALYEKNKKIWQITKPKATRCGLPLLRNMLNRKIKICISFLLQFFSLVTLNYNILISV